MTRTYAILDVSPETYREIRDRLKTAAYDHAFRNDVLDMHGIALRPGAIGKGSSTVATQAVVEGTPSLEWSTCPRCGSSNTGWALEDLEPYETRRCLDCGEVTRVNQPLR